MTETVLREIVHRAVRDGSYRAQLRSDPAAALAGSNLTAEERAAIALPLDQDMPPFAAPEDVQITGDATITEY